MRIIFIPLLIFGLFLNLLDSHECLAKKGLHLLDSEVTYSIDSANFERIEKFNELSNTSSIVLPNDKLFLCNPDVKKEYWYKIKVTNNNSYLTDWILVSYFYTIDEIDVFLVDSLGKIEKQYFRSSMSVFSREIKHKQPSFPISIKPNETKTLYLRIKNESTYEYTFGIFSHFHFFSRYFKEYFFVGLFYGLMIFVFIYSLINYIFFRDNVVLIYLFFILSQTVHMLFRDGNGIFILPINPEYADLVKNLSRASISVFILIYTLYFLKIEKSTITFKLVVLFILMRIAYALYILENTTIITFHFELFAILISTGLSIKAFINKDIDAKYMVVGLSMMSVSYFIFYLSVVWISSIGNIGFFIMYFGIAGESIFTTLALTERFKRIKLESYKKDQISHELEKAIKEGTELIRIQNNLLEEQSVELNSFLYSASHNLTGPIKSIEGLINLAKIDPEANRNELYGMMSEKLSTLEYNIRDLNSISVIRNKGKNHLEINFENIHKEILKQYSSIINSSNISISFQSNLEKVFLNDYYSIKIIYQNLFENAIKFRDQNKQSFIKISVTEIDNKIQLTFEDNGVGIEPEKISQIFQMFFRGHENTRNDTGLGLYMVKLAVRKLNGEVDVKSQFGKGSIFKIVFPIQ